MSVYFMRFFAWPIFRLTLLTFRPKKRDKQIAPSWHLVLLELFSSVSAETVLETYTYGVMGGSLRLKTPHCWPPITPHRAPHNVAIPLPSHQPQLHPPPPPAPITVATDEQPIAENTQFYTNFSRIFFKLFENFCHFSFSTRRQQNSSRVLY